MNIIERILNNPLDTKFDIASLIHGSMLEVPELELTVDGIIT
jgi:transposase